MNDKLKNFSGNLEGDLFYDSLWRRIFATDASVYRTIPQAVACPATVQDIKELISFARRNKTSLIPRTAGTSLAGQCVGEGIVVDVSKYFTKILDLNVEKKTVKVQPGVIRDDLNRFLQAYDLFFGPNTSTSNRCMIGGMVGNNSSGTTSIKYGVTRDKVVEMKVLLSDGSEAVFSEITSEEFSNKLQLDSMEGEIYRKLYEELKPEVVRQQITAGFPKPEIHRRNTGYAVDELILAEVLGGNEEKINICKLLCGSEGTLAFTTEITLQLDELPPSNAVMIAAHFDSVEKCLQAVVPAMRHSLFTCEMMDKVILDCTKNSLKYKENRFFIEGDPAAILMLEIRATSQKELTNRTAELLKTLTDSGLAYALPVLRNDTIELALELRKAGLGLLGNIVGDRKAVACIEDTAVAVEDLAAYISEFSQLMKNYGQEAVYYAHAGAGELHLRPILNLKKDEDVALFRKITEDVASLVKKYGGSMSGEHGDGRVRAEFIRFMIGDENYDLLKRVKYIFDPGNIFNPGKIIDAPPMDESLRYEPGREEPEIETLMDFSDSLGILRGAENCNGSGDCRKPAEAGGTMCPSYRATRNEKDTTRARANALREFLTNSNKPNRFDHEELKEILDLCISCKGCKSECPSNVDMAAYKAEFQYQYKQVNGSSIRSKAFAFNAEMNKKTSKISPFSNFMFSNSLTSGILKKAMGIASQRSLPPLSRQTLSAYYQKNQRKIKDPIKTVYLFNDEFTNYLDSEVGVAAIKLLNGLNYEVKIIDHPESGRGFISKGFLKEAREVANKNIGIFKEIISEESPLLGLEPSAILSFRDEYLRLADDKPAAARVSKNAFLLEEFFKKEVIAGNITADSFTSDKKRIKLHGHCHQKALSGIENTFVMLNLPQNFEVTVIPSGCCGMAGSFGYEKEHYEVSMQIGEQTLFPAVRKASEETVIAAPGTSCRHQIFDGTGKKALHPVSIMAEALK
ncbi:FAD-binding and (Fe-S)-binding domain-containing protein [Salinimicrobium sediminilitoris]|uniref:FAD-binding and (Fe-S)-binding domain-containing protein n=1 Tax=Salinimicrobium sediminilitoris TaxID=2876715 RepID=UPI001E2FBEC7|nr:FAD-binding and (Fe-S)-binding domain-containing protein [Salinimicrobium sediminilitoris]MCC8358693.1 FAD-binding protein [Salinimicrobium sediminilitoris]